MKSGPFAFGRVTFFLLLQLENLNLKTEKIQLQHDYFFNLIVKHNIPNFSIDLSKLFH